MDTGFLAFASFANDASYGSTAWINTANAQTNNGSYSDNNGSGTTYYLRGTGLVGVPPYCSSGLITGVEIRYEGVGAVSENSVRAVIGGSVIGNNKSQGTSWAVPLDTFFNRGGAGDLWGIDDHSLHGWRFTSSDSGVGVAASGGGSYLAQIDVIEMKLYYEPSLFYMF